MCTKINSFQGLLSTLKKHEKKIIFVVGKPAHLNFDLDELLTPFVLQNVFKFHVINFDCEKKFYLGKFFKIAPYELDIITLLPECPKKWTNISPNELRFRNNMHNENIMDWLISLFLKIRGF